MKKLFTLFLAVVIAATLCIPAFAEETGSITINGVSTSTTYEVYRILDLTDYNSTDKEYIYEYNPVWRDFFDLPETQAYIKRDDTGVFAWQGSTDDVRVAAFAKLALAYAKDNDIDPVKTSQNAGDFTITGTTGVFSGLPLGYYLVDSTMGALCGLTTTNPDASINAKNGIPTVDKQVQEDSTAQWGASNTADIGQIVEYRVTVNVHAGAENYVLHDEMSDGLTFEQDPLKTLLYPTDTDPLMQKAFRGVWYIEHVIPGTGSHEVPADKYAVKTGTDMADSSCTFEISFTKEFCDELQTNDKIIVHYNAMLNRDADIAENQDSLVNPNIAWLTFGEGGKSNEDSVTTRTHSFDIVKTDDQNTLIDGAKFKIYDAETGGNEVKVVYLTDEVTDEKILDAKGNPMYRRARANESGIEIAVKDGIVTVVGFDNGTYYLEETEAPEDYSPLQTRQKFIISDSNLTATFNGEIYSTGSGIHVVNYTGIMLPETGGMGTMLFVTGGMIAVLGAGVLLVTKKRMSMIEG